MKNFNDSFDTQKYCFAIEANGGSYWEYNIQNDSFYFSDKLNRILGYAADTAITATKWSKLIHPDDKSQNREFFANLYRGKTNNYSREFRVQKFDGTYVWLRERGSVYSFDGEGKPLLVVGTHADMTQAKMIYKSNEEYKELYALAFEKSPYGVLLLDAMSHEFLDANPKALEMVGAKNKKELLKHPANLSPKFQPDGEMSFEKFNAMIEIARIQGEYTFEWLSKRLNSKEFWIEVTLTLVALEGRDLLYTTWKNIDENKKVQNQLKTQNLFLGKQMLDLQEDYIKSSHSRFQQLLENSDFWVWEIDIRGYFTYVNARVETLLGYKAYELVGKTMFDIMPKLEVKRIAPLYRNIVQNHQKIVDMLNIKHHQDGRNVYLSTYASPFFNDRGELLGYRGLDKDITKDIKSEQELKKQKILLEQREKELSFANIKLMEQTQELREANRSAQQALKVKSQFLANMSHDIRTPMNGVLGMTHLVLETNLSQQQKSYVETIQSSAKVLLEIIDEILDLSKIEAGELSIQKSNFSLYRIIEQIFSTVELSAKEKGLEIGLHYEKNIQEFYIGDALRFSQILINLIGNAIKFTSKGHVKLFVSQVDGDTMRFEVIDTGIGLTQEQQSTIFEAFTQANGTTTRQYGGTGLGLTIAKELVELMGGTIWCESQLGQGSRFIFEIVLEEGCEIAGKEESKAYIAELKQTMTKLSGSAILLVEDNVINQEIVVGLLKGSGIVIDRANNGLESVEMYQANPTKYELILMDMQMPIMDGVEATKKLRKIGATLPIVALSANAMQEDVQKTQQAGMNHHLKKPVEIERLYETLLKYLSSQEPNAKPFNQKLPKQNNVSPSQAPVAPLEIPVETHRESDKLPKFKTFSKAVGLSYCGGDETLYVEILHNFRSQYYGIHFETMQEEELKRTLHTLKGHANTIGANKLHLATVAYEKSLESSKLHLLYLELHGVIEEIEEKLVEVLF